MLQFVYIESPFEQKDGFKLNDRLLFVRLFILLFCSLLVACQSDTTTPESEKTNLSTQKKQATNQSAYNKSSRPKKDINTPVKPDKPLSSSSKADSQGIITKIEKAGPQKVKIYLDEQSGTADYGSKGKITVDHETNIHYTDLQTLAPVTIKDLKVNKKVSIWCTGVYTKIFPLQCTAGEVVLGD